MHAAACVQGRLGKALPNALDSRLRGCNRFSVSRVSRVCFG
jgi:hypothetical protein